MLKANIDVAKRVITGNINPGMVKVKTEMKTDLGIIMLANSITLTPGTLSVDIDENTNTLHIHCLNIQTPEEILGNLQKWVKRIAE
jgi:multicomponent Na+:H+ antiporter subunit E